MKFSPFTGLELLLLSTPWKLYRMVLLTDIPTTGLRKILRHPRRTPRESRGHQTPHASRSTQLQRRRHACPPPPRLGAMDPPLQRPIPRPQQIPRFRKTTSHGEDGTVGKESMNTSQCIRNVEIIHSYLLYFKR